MASEAADGKPIGHHFAEWWERVPGRRSAREEGGCPSKKCLRGNFGTGEPAAKPGPGAEREGVGWKHAAAPVGLEGIPCGRRPFSHRASLLLSRRY